MSKIIDTLKAFEVLSGGAGASCHKTAIYVVAGPASTELKGHNAVDNNDFVVPVGLFVSIGAKNLEVQPLLREKKGTLQPTHATLYDLDKPMTYEEAAQVAMERSIETATPEKVIAAFESLGEKMPHAWHFSKGHVLAFRMPQGTGDVENCPSRRGGMFKSPLAKTSSSSTC